MITRREAITNKVYNLLSEISVANGSSVDFDGKYKNRVEKIPEDATLTFHLRDVRNRHDEGNQHLDFEIDVVSRNGSNNYNYINNATMEILSALFAGIEEIRELFGNQCRWIPVEQGFEIEFTADRKQAEITIAISLHHIYGEGLFTVDLTDYTFADTDKIFITAAGKKFKTSDGKQFKVPRK